MSARSSSLESSPFRHIDPLLWRKKKENTTASYIHKTLIFLGYRYFNLFYVIICTALTPGLDSGDLLHRGNISWVPHLVGPRTTTQSGGLRHQSSAHVQ